MLNRAFEKADYLSENRIIRGVLFLADRDMQKLRLYIDAAIGDPRDIMFWAEYKNYDDQFPLHLRDFNKPFGQAEMDVKE